MAGLCPSDSVADSYVFISSHCLPASLVLKIQLSWMGIFSITSFFILLAVIYTVRTHRYVIPLTVLTYAFMTSLALLGHVTAFYFGLQGFPRMIAYGLPMSILMSGVTYLIWAWFRFVISTTLNNSKKLQSEVKLGFYIFNIIYHIVFWGIWLSAAYFGTPKRASVESGSESEREEEIERARRINNILVSAGLLWLGSMACVVGMMVFFLGKRLSAVIQGAVDLAKSLKKDASAIQGTVSKIRHYSLLQSVLWVTGGIGLMGVGLWGLSTLERSAGMAYFYYVISFWLLPTMLLADLLLVYAAVHISNGRRRIAPEGSRSNTSAIETGNRLEEFSDFNQKSRQEIEL